MLVWIFQTGEPLHIDPGVPRAMRAMNLANALVNSGHRVRIWSSAFNHQEKRHRSRDREYFRVNDSLEVSLIPSCGYEKNIGLGRMVDHAQLAINLNRALATALEVPDVAFVGYPPIEFAFVAVKWLKKHGVAVMLDAKDQWPHIFVDAFPRAFQPFANLIFSPYFYMGKKTFEDATAFCTMSNGFLDWMGRFSERALNSNDCVIPLSPMHQDLSPTSISDAIHWWNQVGVASNGQRRFFFIGNLSRAFDFDSLIDTARLASEAGKNWQFVVCGTGPNERQLSKLIAGLGNVVMPGWVDRAKIYALAGISVAGLAPYRNTSDFVSSIPNKIVDYLSLGKPIVSPLVGEVEVLLREYCVGYSYLSNDRRGLFNVLENLCSSEENIELLSKNAVDTYRRHFSGEMVYKELVNKLELLPSISSQIQ